MQNEQNISTAGNKPETDALYQKRLDLLKAELALYHPDLISGLGASIKMLVVEND